jgi:hypothetical protein
MGGSATLHPVHQLTQRHHRRDLVARAKHAEFVVLRIGHDNQLTLSWSWPVSNRRVPVWPAKRAICSMGGPASNMARTEASRGPG